VANFKARFSLPVRDVQLNRLNSIQSRYRFIVSTLAFLIANLYSLCPAYLYLVPRPLEHSHGSHFLTAVIHLFCPITFPEKFKETVENCR
jgi:hypothetical protein